MTSTTAQTQPAESGPTTMTLMKPGRSTRTMPPASSMSTPPTTSAEAQVFTRLWTQYAEVIRACKFDGFSGVARDDLRGMLAENCFRRMHLYLDRYAPTRNRHSVADIERLLAEKQREERGAFRMWVRHTARWMVRDYLRQRRIQGAELEVSYDQSADPHDEHARAMDHLRAAGIDGGQEESVESDWAADMVAELMQRADPTVRRDMALFLGAAETDDPRKFYRSHGVTHESVVERLRANAVTLTKRVSVELGA